MKIFYSILASLFLMINSMNGQGFKIEITVRSLADSPVYIGYHFADKKYVRDTLLLDSKGKCIYSGEEPLPGGVYLLVFPNMNFIEFLVSDDQHFAIQADTVNMVQSLRFSGSEENTKFLEYQEFMIEKQKYSIALREDKNRFSDHQDSLQVIDEKLKMVDNQIKAYWDKIISENKGTLLGNLINALRNPDIPDFELDEEEGNIDSLRWVHRYRFNRDHFLDNIDFSDERLLRTPVVYNKLDHYANRVLIQRPDSIIPPIYKVVERAKSNEKVFQYVLVFLLNNYLQSTIMGMDEVYVFLAEEYYLSGQATWADSSFLAQTEDRVAKIKPNLIGRTARDLKMESNTGEWFSLHEVDAKYTILYFWEPNCGHCKTATPLLYDLYNKYRENGVEVFAVYTQDNKEEWLNYLNEKGFDWINVYDPTQNTFFRFYYDIYSTPVVYLLDNKKSIVAKRISVESLDDMLDGLLGN